MNNFKTLLDLIEWNPVQEDGYIVVCMADHENSVFDKKAATALYSTLDKAVFTNEIKSFFISMTRPNARYGNIEDKMPFLQYDEYGVMQLPEDKLPLMINVGFNNVPLFPWDTLTFPSPYFPPENYTIGAEIHQAHFFEESFEKRTARQGIAYHLKVGDQWVQLAVKDDVGYIGLNNHEFERGILVGTVGYMSQGVPLKKVRVSSLQGDHQLNKELYDFTLKPEAVE